MKSCFLILISFLHRSESFVLTTRTSSKFIRSDSRWLSTSTLLGAIDAKGKAWKKINREEDEVTDWYLLNCIAGLELDLLHQCREMCAEMPSEDVEKFVVPTMKQTRSHGKSRMLTEKKVKYQGYVFAKLRLCEETYEAIQGLDLCRSWMGTIHRKGHKKLPPIPVPLNEVEVEDYGLEDIEEDEEEEEEEEVDDDIILDTEETDARDEAKRKKENDVDQEQLKEFLNLKVDDMIKVIEEKSKFYGEDGTVKRLKAGKIMIRFFTYGSMYDEWLDPAEVRKLTTEELLKGLSGPAAPITQRDLEDGDDGFGGPRHHPGGRAGLRDALMSNVRGVKGTRNTRRDRVYRDKDSYKDKKQEDDNWSWYQKQQEGGSQRDFTVGSFQNQPDFTRSEQRQRPRRERRDYNPNPKQKSNLADALDGTDDWSAFVSSPGDTGRTGSNEDDFFDSLMSELNAEENKQQKSNNDDNDEFFSSFMSELENDANKAIDSAPKKKTQSQSKPPRRDDDNDFFANLEAELAAGGNTNNPDDDDFFSRLEAELNSKDDNDANTEKITEKKTDTASDDFFANLEKELENNPDITTGKKTDTASDDFFANLEKELESNPDITTGTKADTAEDDFFSQLEKELESERTPDITTGKKADTASDDFFSQLENELANSATPDDKVGVKNDDFFDQIEKELLKKTSPSKNQKSSSKAKAKAPTKVQDLSKQESIQAAPLDEASLGKKTIPVLKNMLRERGLKVSGKKIELIERLLQ